jgi:hypothetical protein
MIVPRVMVEAPAYGEVPPARTANKQELTVRVFTIEATSTAFNGYTMQPGKISD